MDEATQNRFVEAKSHLSTEQALDIAATHDTFVADEVGSVLAEYGAAREVRDGAGDGATWMVEPAFRDFLKRSI